MTRICRSAVLSALIAGACLACSSGPEPKTTEDRPASERRRTERLDGSNPDLFLSPSARAAPRLLDRLLADFLAAHPPKKAPVIAVRAIRNTTDQHLDTRVLRDRCTAALTRGGYQVSLPPSRLGEELEKTEAGEPDAVWTPPALLMRGQVLSTRRVSETKEVVETIFELEVDRIANGEPVWSGRRRTISTRRRERR